MKTTIKKPTEKDRHMARESLELLKFSVHKLKASSKNEVKIKLEKNDETVIIPEQAMELLYTILENMAEGNAVSVISPDIELSTQEAADMLNVSRPHLVRLLEEGKIPFKKVGSHRRVLYEDVLAHKKQIEKLREKQLEILAAQAQELNLGYE